MIEIQQSYYPESRNYEYGHCITTYTGSREELISLGIVTRSMFPKKASFRKTSGQSHPESGEWRLDLIDEKEDVWIIRYYSTLEETEYYPECTEKHSDLMRGYVRFMRLFQSNPVGCFEGSDEEKARERYACQMKQAYRFTGRMIKAGRC